MCTTFKIAKTVIDEFVEKKLPFTIEQVSKTIKSRGGVHRVAVGVTTKDYLEVLEEEDKIVYDFSTMKYFNTQVLEEL